MAYQIITGDNRHTLKSLADNSIDSIVTDPPYGIDFLGKAWDANTGALETYQECLRVLKPGGHILAFSAARTYHHLAVTLEQAGFEIRDQIMWIYSSGFPKSQDVGRQIQKAIHGKPDKQRFDPAVMIKIDGDKYRHPDSDKVYRKLPDINGDRLKKSHEGEGYGCVFEEIIVPTNTKTYIPNIDDNRNVANSTTGSPRCQMCDKSTGPIWKKCPDERTDCIKPWIPDLLNEWSGWGTSLKPAHEPIALARKPMKSSTAKNCQQWGVGALNIDACRVPYESEDDYDTYINNLKGPMERSTAQDGDGLGLFEGKTGFKAQKGKVVKSTKPKIGTMGTAAHDNYNAEKNANEGLREGEQLPWTPSDAGRFPSNVLGEIANYQKYFYCPKVSRAERHIGFDTTGIPTNPDGMWDDGVQFQEKKQGVETLKEAVESVGGTYKTNEAILPGIGMIKDHGIRAEVEKIRKAQGITTANVGNNHPTVKPIELMKYLIKLVTPPGGTVLDPFCGSGSTGCAAVELGHTFIGCELDPNYVEIAQRRIAAWQLHTQDPTTFNNLFSIED